MQARDVERLVMKPTRRRRLGKYVLVSRLGHGGMGKIYLAQQAGPAGLEKLVVIKRLHSHLSGDEVLVENFLDEARLSLALSHPNIVHTFDVGQERGRYFIAMEYIDGQTLGVLMRYSKKAGQYPGSEMWGGLFSEALEGLHAAHRATDARGRMLGVIHRDVSPQNIIVGYDAIPRLADFGIAKAALRLSETDAGVLKGKYAYMSPEQCRSEPMDHRSDIFAAGVVFWEMLAGRRLYKTDSILKTVERIQREPPPSPRRVNPDADDALCEVAKKALQKDPADRFQTAEEFKEAIDVALHESGKRYRSRDMRELIGTLFADVRTRQQQVLSTALADTSIPADEPIDSEAMHADMEPATPSVVESGSWAIDPGIDDDEDAAGQAIIPADATPPATLRNEIEPQRAPAVAIAIILMLLVIIAGGGFWLMRNGLTNEGEPVASAPTATASKTPTDTAPEKPAAKTAPHETPPVDKPATADAGSTKDRAGNQDSTGASDDSATAKAAADKSSTTASDTSRKPTPKEAVPTRRRRPKSSQRTPAASATPTKPTTPPPPVKVKKATGLLTLQTSPWTEVYLGKKKLGNTPLVEVELPAGQHSLVLRNKDEGIEQTYVVVVKEGKTVKKRLGLK